MSSVFNIIASVTFQRSISDHTAPLLKIRQRLPPIMTLWTSRSQIICHMPVFFFQLHSVTSQHYRLHSRCPEAHWTSFDSSLLNSFTEIFNHVSSTGDTCCIRIHIAFFFLSALDFVLLKGSKIWYQLVWPTKMALYNYWLKKWQRLPGPISSLVKW